MRVLNAALCAVALLASTASCATYHDQLVRGQNAFEKNEHERVVGLLRDLEPDVHHLEPAEQAQYAYLRGMSDYRLGFRRDARHWLAVAQVHEEASPGVLPADWKKRTNEALEELNAVVYADGIDALGAPAAAKAEDGSPPSKRAPAAP